MSRHNPSRPSQSILKRSPNLQRSRWWKRRMLPTLLPAMSPLQRLHRSFPWRPSPRHSHLNPNHTPPPSSTRGHRQFTRGTAASRHRGLILSRRSTILPTTNSRSRPSPRDSGGETTVPVEGGEEAPESRRHVSRSHYLTMLGRGTEGGGEWRSASDCAGAWWLERGASWCFGDGCCRYPCTCVLLGCTYLSSFACLMSSSMT